MPRKAAPGGEKLNRYAALLERIFFAHYAKGAKLVPFERSELAEAASSLKIILQKNLGDAIYAMRYRMPLPASIVAKQPPGKEWIIIGAGKARYAFKLVTRNRIAPTPELVTIKIPDATPEIIAAYALTDEQALLAKVRYNRLLDVFLGIATYSLQNHLRTTVKNVGQIEIDEIYVGLDRHGRQFVIPVQAKAGKDKLSAVQTEQDIAYCAQKYPTLICRSVSAQFMSDDRIALFELTLENGAVKVVDEKHYRLLPSGDIGPDDLRAYASRKP